MRDGSRLVLSFGMNATWSQCGRMTSIFRKRPPSVMNSANRRYAAPRIVSQRDCTSGIDCLVPPNANHAPIVKRNCQVNGLKYQEPAGYAMRFQPRWRAARYSTKDANNVRFGLRSSAHSTGGNTTIRTI